ncbi:MmgE/PrpD family protein [Bordetella sp. BOR01]|uniref:MmgE/PrpD family protein n=1 Tax=Bordetella sp. BOR01 TaxID=2854779 RepID=UPI001C46A169|nr:MmgE/PrpD family protein [Bordetella sp. BOR01]MBV7483375.1 MmgE/PrpD family protein [Bordetella sp. BOR01]
MRITRELAEFVAATPSSAIPADVRQHTVRTMVNWVACALGGAYDPTVLAARNALRPFMGPPRATLIGHADKVDVLHAAFLNAVSSHVLDFDDTHLETLVHPSGPVLAALLALAQHQPLTGKDFIDAAVLGIEAECRIALGLGKAHYDAGWHVTGTAGVCGAAVAAGRALGLDTRGMGWALGIAATQAAGLREMFGSMCKSLHAGRAAQNGLSAALMAQAGFTSSDQALEAPRGMARVMSSQPELARILQDLGSAWETSANTFKPYACGLVIHPVIDACREIAGQGVPPDAITEVVLHVHPLVVELTGKPSPTTGLEAKFSVFHCAAATLIDGASRHSHFSQACVADTRVAALRDRVRVQVQEGMRPDAARAIVALRDGSQREAYVAHALGSMQRPMSEGDLSAKFRALAAESLPAGRIEEVLQQCWAVEASPDVAALADTLAG